MRYPLLAAVLLVGCAAQPGPSYVWRHDSGVSDKRQFDRDYGNCKAQALAHPYMSTERGLHLFVGCMEGKGWALMQR